MSSSVEQIKERLSIADVVGSYLKLEKAGNNLKAKCPFHNERTPSFFVSPSRGTYYCFGCQAHGDIFTFVEQFEGLDFAGALKTLAARAGIELIRENPKVRNERDRLYRALEKAAEFFEQSLSKNSAAKSYLVKRGVKDGTVKSWQIGFAPNEWRALHDHLLKEGFSTDEMIAAGLVKRGEKGFFDLFRGRIMFPIFDSSGRVIAFSGRIMPEFEDGKSGKYVNSPETELFRKSRTLYGLNKAKTDIRKRDYSIIVEGQMDLIMSHQAGFTNTVAVSGTALTGSEITKTVSPSFSAKAEGVTETKTVLVTTEALGLLKHFSNNLIFAFDADEAGLRAVQRAAMIALDLGFDFKVAAIKGGKDAADLILENPAKWAAIIKDAKHIIDFSLETLLDKKLEPRALGRAIVSSVLPYVAKLASAIDRDHFIKTIAEATGIQEEALREELKKIRNNESVPAPENVSVTKAIHARDGLRRRTAALFYWLTDNQKLPIDAIVLKKRIKEILGPSGLESLLSAFVENKNELLYEAEAFYDQAKNFHKAVAELLINLELEIVDEKLDAAMAYGKKSNNIHDIKAINDLSLKKQELTTRRQSLDKERIF